MFVCERCGSSYNPAHAVALEYCPRCMVRERAAATLKSVPLSSRRSLDYPLASGESDASKRAGDLHHPGAERDVP